MSSIGLAASGLLAELRSAELIDVDDVALAAELVELRGVVDAVEAEWLRRLEVFDRRGGAAGAGAVSTGAWVRAACRLSPGAARSRVELARSLPNWPATADALASGAISTAHAGQLTAAAQDLAAAAGPRIAAETEPALVHLATHVDPARLRRELAHVRHALTPDAAQRAADTAHSQRRLSVSETFAGMVVVDGILDPEAGAILLSALMPLTARCGPDDHRTPRQRRADALTDLCRRHLDTGDLPTTGGERPHLTVIVDLDTLQHRAATHALPQPHSRTPARHTPSNSAMATSGDPAATSTPANPTASAPDNPAKPSVTANPAASPPATPTDPTRPPPANPPAPHPHCDPITITGPRAAETTWAGPITAEAARRLACDAAITRVITTAPSQPLDVGRRTRTIPPAIRTALVIRDRGCAFPHCDRPPAWTDAHHLHHWAHGGTTTLDNLVLLCRTHHRTVHEGHWQLTRTPHGHWTAQPPHHTTPAQPLAA
jgi:Domain of unknown function (DUF222)/HNH endonuclease